ncbi:MAG: hypothetical protein CBB87_02545 [Micavibrio sp. TMED27]|nr:hypothetical protein [Micavibrio sp.]OUT92202.1 MAG: hypothetical protein CBB87_02545 [Micavibrio sp. TMED27]|tara:strand:- start:190 stop:447 length:258 start_codon:yes stop_codon:yes gene_type:complete
MDVKTTLSYKFLLERGYSMSSGFKEEPSGFDAFKVAYPGNYKELDRDENGCYQYDRDLSEANHLSSMNEERVVFFNPGNPWYKPA